MNSSQISARMRKINAELPPNDGVAIFNRVYLISRENVLAAVKDGYFQDAEYIHALDVAFGHYWLKAYDSQPDVPLCWKPLFRERLDPLTLPIQFIIAGLIAHIFRDLSLAVFDTETWARAIPNKLFVSWTHWPDFNRVSDILEQTMNETILPEFRDSYNGDVLLGIDALLAGFSIRMARTDAWDRGNTMRLTSPLVGSAEGSELDTIFSAEAGLLSEGFLAPPLATLLPIE